jgi:dolichol-phosphate mannosyltransferase
MKKNDILIFLPTLNEQENIAPLLSELFHLYKNCDFYIIDDASRDDTIKNINRLSIPNLTVLVRSHRLGIGSAHKMAISFAWAEKYKILVTMDSDGTHRPMDVRKLLDNILENDLVIGSRFIDKDSVLGWSWFRRFLTSSGHLVTKIGLGIHYDCSSGFRAYNLTRNSFRDIVATNDNHYDFFYKSLYNFHQNNPDKISEVAITLLARSSGNSKLSIHLAISSISKLVVDIIRFRLNKILVR